MKTQTNNSKVKGKLVRTKRFCFVLTSSQAKNLSQAIENAEVIYLDMLDKKTNQLNLNSYAEVKRINQAQERQKKRDLIIKRQEGLK